MSYGITVYRKEHEITQTQMLPYLNLFWGNVRLLTTSRRSLELSLKLLL